MLRVRHFFKMISVESVAGLGDSEFLEVADCIVRVAFRSDLKPI